MFYQVSTLYLLLVMTCYSLKANDNFQIVKSPCSRTKYGEYSFKSILRKFPGVFYTKNQIKQKEQQFRVARMKYLARQGIDVEGGEDGDGDACCPTKILTFTNLTMTNINGEAKIIVHNPPKYQFIPHGICLGGGTCEGICANEPMTHSLLTYNVDERKLEFDLFTVPGYCSCKKVKHFVNAS